MKLIPFLTALLLLTTGSAALAQAAQAPENVAVKNNESIAFMGDSITAQGANLPGGYVRLVISGLKANGITVTPFPVGIGGQHSTEMLERLERDVLSKKPTWMTLSCGVNDVWHGEKGVPLEVYKTNITALVDQAQAAGVKVMILTATMIGETPDNPNNVKLAGYNDFLRQLAQAKKCPLADLNADMQAAIKPGNCLPLRNIPVGSTIHCIEMLPGKGAQLARSAGTSAQLMSKEGKYAQVKLPSSEVRMILMDCKATIGRVGNVDHDDVSIGKAGRSRWLGIRPHVRGVAMNPVDHPHGGGEGRTSGGRHPVTPWGIPTKGYKTRTNKTSTRFIVKKRSK